MDTIASLFSFITTPVSWVIVQFHTVYGALFGDDTGWAWGLSIVSLVILIRICLIPLFVKQIKATRAMQTLQPEMKKIQERYKNDKQRQSEEMMKLYKETGTNPLSSCLPILAQSPFFFALYHVLANIADGKPVGAMDQQLVDSAREAKIFGAPIAAKFMDDPSKVEALGASLTDVRIVTAIMIILMSLSQFYTQRQLMQKNVDLTVKTPFMQQQKMLMYIFPVIFAVMGINFPVGVLVYWLTTNVWTMGQQMYVINQNPTPGSKAQDQYLTRLLKNISGLWLVQECQRIWRSQGQDYNWEGLTRLAADAGPLRSVFNPDDPRLGAPNDMPAEIAALCREAGEPEPDDHGAILRSAFESLALRYRQVLDMLEQLGGAPIHQIHIVGGGTQNKLLCQMAADACNRPVLAGPIEATAIGNVMMQAIAAGDVGSVPEAREVIRKSFDMVEYLPQADDRWAAAAERFAKLA